MAKDRISLRWLYPGMHVKRWLLLLVVGTAIIGLGLSYILRNLYYGLTFPSIFYYLTLQFLPRLLRAFLFGALGLGMVVTSLLKLNQSILGPLQRSEDGDLAEVVYRHWHRDRGPKVVAIGGRGSRKDFIDLHAFLRTGGSLESVLQLVRRRFTGIDYNEYHLLKSLVFFEDAETEPMPGLLRAVSWEEVKETLVAEVRRIS